MRCFLLLALLASASAFVPAPLSARQGALCARSVARPNRGQKLEMVSTGNVMGALGLLLSSASLYSRPVSAAPLAESFLGSARVEKQIMVAETETRQGLYKEYTIEKTGPQFDDAKGTFKSKEATETNKNKYVAILSVLLVGSFVIPMVQYFYYVKDDEV